MIASGLIELGFTVAGPDTGDDYDARVVDLGDGQGPRIVTWRARTPQPAMAEIIAAGKARETRMVGVRTDKERIAELEAEVGSLKGRMGAVEKMPLRG